MPVNVDAIARSEGIDLAFRPFDGNVSAVLYRQPEMVRMGVNSCHSDTRQRFSIAHELGHFALHKGDMYLDKVRLNFRDERASMGSWSEEIEANEFAAELLMPEDQIIRAVHRRRSQEARLDETELLTSLATEFWVSPEAMGYRLANLGVRSPW
jgi:Zn-dependent peptidase ImmA (M78 family)